MQEQACAASASTRLAPKRWLHDDSGVLKRSSIVRFEAWRHHLKERENLFWNGQRSSRLALYEYPLGFTASDHSVIGLTQKEVFPQRTHLAKIGNPGANHEAITRKCRLQILNMMTSDHPRCADLPGNIRTTGGIGVGDGGLLHPAQILDVIGMAIRVDGILGNKDAVAIRRRKISIFQGELRWRHGMPEIPAASLFCAAFHCSHVCLSSHAFAAGRQVRKMGAADENDRPATNTPVGE